MRAAEINFTKFLSGSKQFNIPIYQRTYSWTLKECRQLWSDIETSAKNQHVSGHFAGSIVYIERGLYHVASVPKLLVIDGQQRLTTLSLLLLALADAIESSDEKTDISSKKLIGLYLLNAEEDGDDKYRLMLTKSDKQTLISLIEKKELPKVYSRRLVDNFEFFKQAISKCDLALDQVFEGIGKLIVIDVALDREKDNPQLIFESLNSTGLDLSQADLIRNYVLMGMETEEQQRIYDDIWFPMEENFGHAEYSEFFDRFMRDYLTIKTSKIPNIQHVYESFKNYLDSNGDVSIEDIMKDVYHYSKLFSNLVAAKDDDRQINDAFQDINALKVDVAYPILLEVYDDYSKGLLGKDDFISILRLVETYVFRRSICEIPTNSLNKTFSTLGQSIDKENYLESFRALLVAKKSYTRLPGDEEFKAALVQKDVYSYTRRSYLLRKLENENRKEKVDIDSYTIEHIMPQNAKLSKAWREELGDEWQTLQQVYLHTIGNLTLTGYNSELSDRSFNDKQNMTGGFKDSPIRLNRGLATLTHWNESEIKHRALELADKAVKVWSIPVVSQEDIEKYDKSAEVEQSEDENDKVTYTLDLHTNNKPDDIIETFGRLRNAALEIAPDITEKVTKFYISYKGSQKWYLSLRLRQKKIIIGLSNDVNDIDGLTEVDKYGERWFEITDETSLSYALDLVESISN